MKNNKNFKAISNSIIISCVSLLLIFILTGMLYYGFRYEYEFGDGYLWYNYIDWKFMAFPLILSIIAGIFTIAKLIKCSIPQYKSSNNKSIGITIICFDILLLVGLTLWLAALIIHPGLSTEIEPTNNLSFGAIPRSDEVVEEVVIILASVGIGSMFVGSIMSPILSKKLED